MNRSPERSEGDEANSKLLENKEIALPSARNDTCGKQKFILIVRP